MSRLDPKSSWLKRPWRHDFSLPFNSIHSRTTESPVSDFVCKLPTLWSELSHVTIVTVIVGVMLLFSTIFMKTEYFIDLWITVISRNEHDAENNTFLHCSIYSTTQPYTTLTTEGLYFIMNKMRRTVCHSKYTNTIDCLAFLETFNSYSGISLSFYWWLHYISHNIGLHFNQIILSKIQMSSFIINNADHQSSSRQSS